MHHWRASRGSRSSTHNQVQVPREERARCRGTLTLARRGCPSSRKDSARAALGFAHGGRGGIVRTRARTAFVLTGGEAHHARWRLRLVRTRREQRQQQLQKQEVPQEICAEHAVVVLAQGRKSQFEFWVSLQTNGFHHACCPGLRMI